MKRTLVAAAFACLLALIVVLGAQAATKATSPVRTTANPVWLPLHVGMYNEVWNARSDSVPVWAARYPKQPNQIVFKLCGLFMGDGTVYITYGDEGDPVYFDYAQPTALCIETTTGYGGGTVPIPLNVYLTPRGANTPTLTSPTVFVDSE